MAAPLGLARALLAADPEVAMATGIAGSDRRRAVAQCRMRTPGSQALSLDLPSCLGTIEAVDAIVTEVAASAGFAGDSIQDIQIAVREATTNAVVHGNDQDQSRRVRLDVAVSPFALEVRVTDEGRGFDPGDVPDPRAPENLRRSCGRGILFMRSLMDDVRFQRSADGGTQVILRKQRHHAANLAAPGPAPA